PGTAAADQALALGWADGSPSGTGNATGTIRGAGSGTSAGSITLNDTGITGCASMTQNGLACPQAGLPGQDAETGRDASRAVTGAGASRTSAFAFSKLPGGCVQD